MTDWPPDELPGWEPWDNPDPDPDDTYLHTEILIPDYDETGTP